MPTTRKSRTRRLRKELADWQIHYLATGEIPDEDGQNPWSVFIFCCGGSTAGCLDAADTWPSVRDRMFADWIAKHPGTRPWAWWRFDAPRQKAPARARAWAGFPDPRRRLGGTGTPKHEALNYVKSYAWGVPDQWITDQDDVKQPTIDEDDPPQFESQAAYLRRHGLLTADESASLLDTAFDPVLLGMVCER